MIPPAGILGWDIGGVNTKAARLTATAVPLCKSVCLPYELQRDTSGLGPTLRAAAEALGSGSNDHHAVTMTAELSQVFRSKREGVGFILDALEASFPHDRFHVYTVTGKFVSPREARTDPLAVAASNWAATANWVARTVPTCVLIDIGTTTTDLIPIVGGKVAAQGRNDPERLLSGELVYTGALRTPAETLASAVPLWGGTARLSAEGFALAGDIHLWLGRLQEQDYTWPTPDGRPATREFAAERLARLVCADRDLLDEAAIAGIATELARAQVSTIVRALETVLQRCPEIECAVVAGLGDFIGLEAAQAVGLAVVPLRDWLNGSSRTAPAAAVAWLLRDNLGIE